MENIRRWTAEPPPEHVFEISERGLAYACAKPSPAGVAGPRVEVFAQRALLPSPSAPNVLDAQSYRDALTRLHGSAANQKRASAALVIPDYAVRMIVADFQEFPPTEAERIALLRFRLRKSVPFHIEEAQISYAMQVQEPKHIEVLAVAIARPILEEYEALFAEHGFRVGLVTPSSLAAFPLFSGGAQGSLQLIVKLAGATVSVLLEQAGRLRLVRSIDLTAGEELAVVPEQQHAESILALIQQTVAFAEDQIGAPVDRILWSGFDDPAAQRMTTQAEREFPVTATHLRSKLGPPTQETAGLLGLMERYAA